MEDINEQIPEELSLKEAFEIIFSTQEYSEYILDIVGMIYKSEISEEKITNILKKHKIKSLEDIKEELLDVIIAYINITLNDHKLSQNELFNVRYLKKLFNIIEGDFYTFRYPEIEETLLKELRHIYRDDDRIDKVESIFKVELQELFDLGYDQFLEFANKEDLVALYRHADILDLDTVIFISEDSDRNDTPSRYIPPKVKDQIWNRDGGKCVKCRSNKNIEYDHIIPLSKGGSNTYRNIQLLCESCNRRKSSRILWD